MDNSHFTQIMLNCGSGREWIAKKINSGISVYYTGTFLFQPVFIKLNSDLITCREPRGQGMNQVTVGHPDNITVKGCSGQGIDSQRTFLGYEG